VPAELLVQHSDYTITHSHLQAVPAELLVQHSDYTITHSHLQAVPAELLVQHAQRLLPKPAGGESLDLAECVIV
jgi:hypothetical protein